MERKLLERSLINEYLNSGAIKISREREKTLKYINILEKLFRCYKCTLRVFHPWPGSGSLDSKIFILGESPSPNRKVYDNFSEKSRKVFEAMLEALGLRRDNIYITNAVKCPLRRSSRREIEKYIDLCLEFLEEEINIVDPLAVILLGETAKKAIDKVLKKSNKRFFLIELPHPMTVVYEHLSLEKYLNLVKQRCGLIKYLI